MATQVRIRRGTAAEHATFTGAPSEITHDTTNNILRVHDGVTPGGFSPPSPAEFQEVLDGKQDGDEKGQPNGYAGLDATGKVPTGQLPADFGSVEVITPSNVAPAGSAVAQPAQPTFQASAFYSLYSQTHAATQLQISTTASFTSPLYDSGDGPPTITPTIGYGILSVSTNYYWRVRYKNSRGVYSNWSTATSFTTAGAFNSYITTPTATPAIGSYFEAGYYAGLIWNEVVQTASSVTIGSASGQRTFTVADMTATPIVYGGQTLEIRSRANPSNKIVGTVASAVGTALTINVTAVAGSGTFTDWSIMARYRVIVAPKAAGEFSSALSTVSSVPAAAIHPSEGWKTTLLWQSLGNAAAYPAAHAVRALSIGGQTDWYIASRDELELCYRNLKPNSSANDTSARAQMAGTLAYAAYADTAGYFNAGANRNSDPTGAVYTGPVPGITAVTAFQTGNSEGWGATYRSCSGYDGTLGYTQDFSIAVGAGRQGTGSPTTAVAWRAVRRSIV